MYKTSADVLVYMYITLSGRLDSLIFANINPSQPRPTYGIPVALVETLASVGRMVYAKIETTNIMLKVSTVTSSGRFAT